MSDKDKGFASMDKEKVREIAAKGGHASHKNTNKGKANDQDRENKQEARGSNKK